MLVLTRETNDGIIIKNKKTGEVIRLLFVQVGYRKCKIGIEADHDWNIIRTELSQK